MAGKWKITQLTLTIIGALGGYLDWLLYKKAVVKRIQTEND